MSAPQKNSDTRIATAPRRGVHAPEKNHHSAHRAPAMDRAETTLGRPHSERTLKTVRIYSTTALRPPRASRDTPNKDAIIQAFSKLGTVRPDS